MTLSYLPVFITVCSACIFQFSEVFLGGWDCVWNHTFLKKFLLYYKFLLYPTTPLWTKPYPYPTLPKTHLPPDRRKADPPPIVWLLAHVCLWFNKFRTYRMYFTCPSSARGKNVMSGVQARRQSSGQSRSWLLSIQRNMATFLPFLCRARTTGNSDPSLQNEETRSFSSSPHSLIAVAQRNEAHPYTPQLLRVAALDSR